MSSPPPREGQVDQRDLTRGGFTEQHLDLHGIRHPALGREMPRVGEVEEVVAGDAEPHMGGVLGSQRDVEHALVVRVGLLLRVPRRERPVVQRRVDALHGQVGPLHEPHVAVVLVDLVGAERVFLGTDAPFDMGDETPLKTIADAPGLSTAQQAQVTSGTALRLLRE